MRVNSPKFLSEITISFLEKEFRFEFPKTQSKMFRQDGPIVTKSVEFAVKIVKYCNYLNSRKQFVFSNQLLKSGTSIGANIFEAQYAESRLDFIHKMKIALKEANETLYWISICEKMNDLEVEIDILKGLKEIMAILSKIIITSKKNLN